MVQRQRFPIILLIGFALVFSCLGVRAGDAAEGTKKAEGEQKAAVVGDGSTVKVHYTLVVDGKEVDSSRKGEPMSFQVGANKVIPGFENAVKGMSVGQKKSFQVKPEDGYGQEDPRHVIEVPKSQLPPGAKPEVGMILYAEGQGGRATPVKIAAVKSDSVMVDFNHPLAGKTLNFDVEIVEIK